MILKHTKTPYFVAILAVWVCMQGAHQRYPSSVLIAYLQSRNPSQWTIIFRHRL
jgi:hypothetical protein